jgi:drug/metabolite transporter (DMT)-like permease
VIFVGLTATSVGFFGMFYGGDRVSPGLATVIANTQPLIAAGLGWIALGERLSPLQRVALAAAFIGIVLIDAPAASTSAGQGVGVLYVLLGAAGVAISNVVLKRLTGRVDILWAMGWQLMIGSLPLIVLALAVEDASEIRWGLAFALSVAALSVLGTALPFVLWFGLLRHATLTQLNVFSFLTPVFGLLAGGLFFEERTGSVQIGGIVLSLVGIYLVSRSPRSQGADRLHGPTSAT